MGFSGEDVTFDDLKIWVEGGGVAYEYDAAYDSLLIDEDFASTDTTIVYDKAGNLINDGSLICQYDAWNRLVKVVYAADTDAVVQVSQYDALGRRIEKTVSNAGDLDGTYRFYYDGQRIVESHAWLRCSTAAIGCCSRSSTSCVVSRPPNGGDEIVMIRIAGKGDYYVHQAERDRRGSVKDGDVTALTEPARRPLRSGGSVVERYSYTPYGEVTVSQITGPGNYDGDGVVDGTDRAAAQSGGACRGSSPSGACRILDLDFDDDVDDNDLTLFDLLDQGDQRDPARTHSKLGFMFGHQGLFYDAEIESYQNRARQYLPKMKRFAQRDPLEYVDGMNVFVAYWMRPTTARDPFGNTSCDGLCERYKNDLFGDDGRRAWAYATCCENCNDGCECKVCTNDEEL